MTTNIDPMKTHVIVKPKCKHPDCDNLTFGDSEYCSAHEYVRASISQVVKKLYDRADYKLQEISDKCKENISDESIRRNAFIVKDVILSLFRKYNPDSCFKFCDQKECLHSIVPSENLRCCVNHQKKDKPKKFSKVFHEFDDIPSYIPAPTPYISPDISSVWRPTIPIDKNEFSYPNVFKDIRTYDPHKCQAPGCEEMIGDSKVKYCKKHSTQMADWYMKCLDAHAGRKPLPDKPFSFEMKLPFEVEEKKKTQPLNKKSDCSNQAVDFSDELHREHYIKDIISKISMYQQKGLRQHTFIVDRQMVSGWAMFVVPALRKLSYLVNQHPKNMYEFQVTMFG